MKYSILILKAICVLLTVSLLIGCLNQVRIYHFDINYPVPETITESTTKCSIDFSGLSPAGDLPLIPNDEVEIAEVLSRDILRLRAIISTRNAVIARIKEDLRRCGVDVKVENLD